MTLARTMWRTYPEEAELVDRMACELKALVDEIEPSVEEGKNVRERGSGEMNRRRMGYATCAVSGALLTTGAGGAHHWDRDHVRPVCKDEHRDNERRAHREWVGDDGVEEGKEAERVHDRRGWWSGSGWQRWWWVWRTTS